MIQIKANTIQQNQKTYLQHSTSNIRREHHVLSGVVVLTILRPICRKKVKLVNNLTFS